MAQSKGLVETLEGLPQCVASLAAGIPKHPGHKAAFIMTALYACLGLVAFGGCAAAPRPYPWNFPEAWEWNQPLETSWQNAVDNWRKLTVRRYKAIEGMVYTYDDVTGLYFPNLVEYADWQNPEENP
jgi:hypothetical protein